MRLFARAPQRRRIRQVVAVQHSMRCTLQVNLKRVTGAVHSKSILYKDGARVKNIRIFRSRLDDCHARCMGGHQTILIHGCYCIIVGRPDDLLIFCLYRQNCCRHLKRISDHHMLNGLRNADAVHRHSHITVPICHRHGERRFIAVICSAEDHISHIPAGFRKRDANAFCGISHVLHRTAEGCTHIQRNLAILRQSRPIRLRRHRSHEQNRLIHLRLIGIRYQRYLRRHRLFRCVRVNHHRGLCRIASHCTAQDIGRVARRIAANHAQQCTGNDASIILVELQLLHSQLNRVAVRLVQGPYRL